MLTSETSLSIDEFPIIARIYHEAYKITSLKDRLSIFHVSPFVPIFPTMVDEYEGYCNFLNYCGEIFSIKRPDHFDELVREKYKDSKKPSVRWMASHKKRIDCEYRKDITGHQLAMIASRHTWGMEDLIIIDQGKFIF